MTAFHFRETSVHMCLPGYTEAIVRKTTAIVRHYVVERTCETKEIKNFVRVNAATRPDFRTLSYFLPLSLLRPKKLSRWTATHDHTHKSLVTRKKLAKAVTLVVLIRRVPGSNIGCDTENSRRLPQSLQGNTGIVLVTFDAIYSLS
jgi:hypothetical protein